MKTTRTRMLIVFASAALIISFFMHWVDVSQGWKDAGRGYNDGIHGR